tara:strand:+ start:1261 stop:1665 length:405 start_codon:yes stop_codon:yes gene_type:complete
MEHFEAVHIDYESKTVFVDDDIANGDRGEGAVYLDLVQVAIIHEVTDVEYVFELITIDGQYVIVVTKVHSLSGVWNDGLTEHVALKYVLANFYTFVDHIDLGIGELNLENFELHDDILLGYISNIIIIPENVNP